jgi:hypothetical protein
MQITSPRFQIALLYLGLSFAPVHAQFSSPSTCFIPNSLKKVPIPTTDPPDHLLYSYHNLQYLSCDYISSYKTDKDASTVFDQGAAHLEAASHSWVYALMASNTYRKQGRVFIIPQWEPVSRWESGSGLALEEWVHKGANGHLDEIVVAFEGTKFESLDDWGTNLSLIYPKQYREAYAYMQCVKQRASGVRIVTTGHSLGGALALNMSLRIPGVDFRGFDMSPRAFFKVGAQYPDADRIFVYEHGEILSALRIFWWRRLKKFPERYWYNFMNFNGLSATVSEHDMYLIARGLLMTAIKNHDANARQAFTVNLSSKDLADAFKDDEGDELSHDIEACKCIFQDCAPK